MFRFCIFLLIFDYLIASLVIPDIPEQHYEPWYRGLTVQQQQQLHSVCQNTTDEICRVLGKNSSELRCWGYEPDASGECLLTKPNCSELASSWAPNRVEQTRIFYKTADFGYIREQREELATFCKPVVKEELKFQSSLQCTKYLRYCVGTNLFLDLKNLGQFSTESVRYREDFLQNGDFGGWNCVLDKAALDAESGHKSPLMSWYGEFEKFVVNETSSSLDMRCDHVFHKPVFVMKLDATSNLYHHFCDFFNLYASIHVNGSHFNRDNHILIWDNHPYRSNFGFTWRAFTKNPVKHLGEYSGKRICAKNVHFPLLPRMIYGMYYNMPLIPGCSTSGLFRAFNRHILHHFRDKASEELDPSNIQVTFISRRTKHRKVLNEDAMLDALKRALSSDVQLKLVNFDHRMDFLDQVAISSSSDVLIGMHGAGLTHTLFQPDFGVLFELYNCEDPDCYFDLARLRGTEYITWQNQTLLESVEVSCQEDVTCNSNSTAVHAKFVDYKFDVEEFVRLSLDAIDRARQRKRKFFGDRIGTIHDEL